MRPDQTHTPAPWYWAVNLNTDRLVTIRRDDADGDVIATLNLPFVIGNRQVAMEANAKFICRAVNSHDDLLAALRGLFGAVASNYPATLRPEMDAARAAIAKAQTH